MTKALLPPSRKLSRMCLRSGFGQFSDNYRHPQKSGQVRPRQGTEICNFGAPSPLEALHWIFCFFSSIYVQFSKASPLISGESCEKSRGENRVKSCHVCGCHGFFGPEKITYITNCLANHFCCQVTITITKKIVERNHFRMCLLFPTGQTINYNLHK